MHGKRNLQYIPLTRGITTAVQHPSPAALSFQHISTVSDRMHAILVHLQAHCLDSHVPLSVERAGQMDTVVADPENQTK